MYQLPTTAGVRYAEESKVRALREQHIDSFRCKTVAGYIQMQQAAVVFSQKVGYNGACIYTKGSVTQAQ